MSRDNLTIRLLWSRSPTRLSTVGKLNKITLTIDRPKLSPEDRLKLEAAKHNNKESE